MAKHATVTEQHLEVLESMRAHRELTIRAITHLRAAILAGEDAYPYYSADGRPYVWRHGERFTAQTYNAYEKQEELREVYGTSPNTPWVLWHMPTPGFYYTDCEASAWATWHGPQQICCTCGNELTIGYMSPETALQPARYICAGHVKTYGLEPRKEERA